MSQRTSHVALSALILLAFARAGVPAGVAEEKAEEVDPRLEWFVDGKLGIFIHWGLYAVNGIPGSWSFFNGAVEAN